MSSRWRQRPGLVLGEAFRVVVRPYAGQAKNENQHDERPDEHEGPGKIAHTVSVVAARGPRRAAARHLDPEPVNTDATFTARGRPRPHCTGSCVFPGLPATAPSPELVTRISRQRRDFLVCSPPRSAVVRQRNNDRSHEAKQNSRGRVGVGPGRDSGFGGTAVHSGVRHRPRRRPGLGSPWTSVPRRPRPHPSDTAHRMTGRAGPHGPPGTCGPTAPMVRPTVAAGREPAMTAGLASPLWIIGGPEATRAGDSVWPQWTGSREPRSKPGAGPSTPWFRYRTGRAGPPRRRRVVHRTTPPGHAGAMAVRQLPRGQHTEPVTPADARRGPSMPEAGQPDRSVCTGRRYLARSSSVTK